MDRFYPNIPLEREDYFWHPYPNSKAFWSVVVPLGVDLTNLVANGSLGVSTIGWGSGNGSTITRLAGGAVGSFHGRATPPVPGAAIQAIYGELTVGGGVPTIDVPFGETVYACVYVRGSVGDNIEVSIITDGVVGPGIGAISSEVMMVDGSNEWVRVNVSMFSQLPFNPTPAPGRTVGILINSDNSSGNDVLDFDGLIMTVGTEAEYFDGDNPDATWDGAPHESTSTVSRFSRAYGTRTNLIDLGLNVFGDSGWGLPPVNNLTTDFARLDGAHLQRQRYLPRVISITGLWEGETAQMHKDRCDFLNSISYRFRRQCTQELLLCYQLHTPCGKPCSEILQIPVMYQSGMEGIRIDRHMERATIQFIANTDVAWESPVSNSAVLDINGQVTIDYEGTEDTWLTFDFRSNDVQTNINRIANETTQTEVISDINMATGYVIFITDPRHLSLRQYPFSVDILGIAIDHAQSQPTQLRLVPGENTIAIGSNNDPPEAEAIVRWNNRYSSVDCARNTNCPCGCRMCKGS